MTEHRHFIERDENDATYRITRYGASRASEVGIATQAEAIERMYEIDPNAEGFAERQRRTVEGHPDKWRPV
jgi:hypothetical protein